MKRLLFLLLLTMIVFLSATACGTVENADPASSDTHPAVPGTASGEEATENTTQESPTSGVPAFSGDGWTDHVDLDLDDATVSILTVTRSGEESDLSSERSYQYINAALTERDMIVEKRLNCHIITTCYKTDDLKTLQEYVTNQIYLTNGSGVEPWFDICCAPSIAMAQDTAMHGIGWDLSDVGTVDLSRLYWSSGFNEAATWGTGQDCHQYTASGSGSINFLRSLNLLVYDQTALAEIGADPVDMVRNGTWTIDSMLSLVGNRYRDLNGNNQRDLDDSYGFLTGTLTSLSVWAPATRTSAVYRDGEGYLALDRDKEADARNLAAQIKTLYEATGTYVAEADRDNISDVERSSDIAVQFCSGHVWMAPVSLFSMENGLHETNVNYGILPLPKLSVQDAYATPVETSMAYSYVIPSLLNTEAARRAGAVLECMASEGTRLLLPAYCRDILSAEAFADSQTQEMLSVLYSGVYVDPGELHGTGSLLVFLTHEVLGQDIAGTRGAFMNETGNKAVERVLTQLNSLYRENKDN